MARKAKLAEKQTQKPDKSLKSPRGTPRNTPRRKIDIKSDDFVIPPYVPSRQKQIPKRFIQIWIPTGRMFSLNGSISEART